MVVLIAVVFGVTLYVNSGVNKNSLELNDNVTNISVLLISPGLSFAENIDDVDKKDLLEFVDLILDMKVYRIPAFMGNSEDEPKYYFSYKIDDSINELTLSSNILGINKSTFYISHSNADILRDKLDKIMLRE